MWRFLFSDAASGSPAPDASTGLTGRFRVPLIVLFALTGWLVRGSDLPGSRLWEANIGIRISTPVSVSRDGHLYFAASGATLYSYSKDGARRWTVPVGSGVNLAPIPAGGDVVVFNGQMFCRGYDAADGRRLYCWEERSGVELWNVPSADNRFTAPTLGAGELYICDYDALLAFDSATGAKSWEFTPGGRMLGRPLLSSDNLLHVATLTHLHAVHGVQPLEESTWPIAGGTPEASRQTEVRGPGDG